MFAGLVIALVVTAIVLSIAFFGGATAAVMLPKPVPLVCPAPPKPNWVRKQTPRMTERMYDQCVHHYDCDRQVCGFFVVPGCTPFTTTPREDWRNYFTPEKEFPVPDLEREF
jgi:hypothetical protein